MKKILVSLFVVGPTLIAIAMGDQPTSPAPAAGTGTAANSVCDKTLEQLLAAADAMVARGLAGHRETLRELVKRVRSRAGAGAGAELAGEERARLRDLATTLAAWTARAGSDTEAGPPPSKALAEVRALSVALLVRSVGVGTTPAATRPVVPKAVRVRLRVVSALPTTAATSRPTSRPTSPQSGTPTTVECQIDPGGERVLGLDGMRAFVRNNPARFKGVPAVIQPAGDVTWKDTIGVFHILAREAAVRGVSFAGDSGSLAIRVEATEATSSTDPSGAVWPSVALTPDRSMPRGLLEAAIGKRRIFVVIDVTDAHYLPVRRIVTRLLSRLSEKSRVAIYAGNTSARPVRVQDWTVADSLGSALVKGALARHTPSKTSTNFVAAVSKVLDAGDDCDAAILITEGRRIENRGNTRIALANLQSCSTPVCLVVVGRPLPPVEEGLRTTIEKTGADGVFIRATQLHAVAGKE